MGGCQHDPHFLERRIVPVARPVDRGPLIIPPELGYRSQGQGDIPPDATLIFDIELERIEGEPDEDAE